MANTPEPEEQERQLKEQQLEEEIEEEQEEKIEAFVPPKHAKRVYHTKPKLSIQDSIQLIGTKDYSNINRITECNHLMDENWHK